MQKEPKQNPVITIAVIRFVIIIIFLKYVQDYTIGLLPQLVSGATPTFPLFIKILIPLGFVLDLPINLISSPILSGITFYVAEALSSLLWGWIIFWLYKKFKKSRIS